jgi:uncharacterized protein (TIGR02448 family)
MGQRSIVRSLTLVITLVQPFEAVLAGNFIHFPTFKDEPLEASTFWPAATTMLPFIATTVLSKGMTEELQRKVAASRDDAASYVASNGEIRGPYLESALSQLRREPAYDRYSDPQLVQAILAWSSR